MERLKIARRTWVASGLTALLVVVGVTGALSASTSATGDKHPAIVYSDGDYIKSLEGTTFKTPVVDGAEVTVLDDYGNETPAVVRDGELWATGTTVPRTKAGADALGVPWPGDESNE